MSIDPNDPSFDPNNFDPNDYSIYGYTPSAPICITFIVLFSLSAVIHTGQAIHFRTWWMLPTMVICTVTETIGWAGRLWSSSVPWDLNPFLMQICCTIFAPSFMTAATFTILGKMIPILGPKYSRLSPKLYLFVFLTADLVALIVQSVGGAKAATSAKDGTDADAGSRIMVGGIIFQMAAITIFVICAVEFLLRYHLDRPVRASPRPRDHVDPEKNVGGGRGILDKPLKLMILGLIINTVFIYIRSIYRTIELLDGWGGSIIQNELLFNVLDGMPIVVACFTFNVFHPGYLLRGKQPADQEPTSNRGLESDASTMTRGNSALPPKDV